MKEITITALQEGQRLDRVLQRVLPQASSGFLYKMLRKKNITLNGKKADGHEKLQNADVIRIYFSEETLLKFSGSQEKEAVTWPRRELDIVYEDDNILLVNKPAGMLTQKAEASDVSLNEYVIGYLLASGSLRQEALSTFRPSVCNRLDRNTSGIVAVGKTSAALRELSAMFRDRTIHKYYRTLVAGEVLREASIEGYLVKDPHTNTVRVSAAPGSFSGTAPGGTADPGEQGHLIRTRYRPVSGNRQAGYGGALTLLEVELITGRSHQIRAHMAGEGYPVIGDPKYGDPRANAFYRREFGLKGQLLHAGRIVFPDSEGPLGYLSGRSFTAKLPPVFRQILKAEQITDM